MTSTSKARSGASGAEPVRRTTVRKPSEPEAAKAPVDEVGDVQDTAANAAPGGLRGKHPAAWRSLKRIIALAEDGHELAARWLQGHISANPHEFVQEHDPTSPAVKAAARRERDREKAGVA